MHITAHFELFSTLQKRSGGEVGNMMIDKSVCKAIEFVFEATQSFGQPDEAVLTDIHGKSYHLNGLNYDELLRILGRYPFWDSPPQGDVEATLNELFRDNDFRLETRWAIEQGTGTLSLAIETRTQGKPSSAARREFELRRAAKKRSSTTSL